MLRKLITENKTDAKKQNTTFNRGNKLSARLALRQRLRQKTKAELKCLVNPNYTFFHMGPA
jgi:hypothetical protein